MLFRSAVKIKMDYCQLRHIYVKYFSDLNKGIYYYNFIVDGKTCIDTKKPSFTCLRLKCNKLKITHCSMNNDSMPIRSSLNWYDYSSRHGFDFVTRDSGFQIKDYAETSTEYELLTKLLDETKIKPQNDLNANKFHFISDSKRKTIGFPLSLSLSLSRSLALSYLPALFLSWPTGAIHHGLHSHLANKHFHR